MLGIDEAKSEGERVKKLVEELVKCEIYEETVWITIGLFSSMRVLVGGAPSTVKDRVQLVLSRLTDLCENVDRSAGMETKGEGCIQVQRKLLNIL